MTHTSPPPHSIEAEQALLGALMLDSEAWSHIAGAVRGDDIYRPDHRAIFGALETLATAGKHCDPVTVANELERQGALDAAGGLAYLSRLARETATAANARAYADIVRERAQLRIGARVSGEIRQAIDDRVSAAQLTAILERGLARLKDGARTDASRLPQRPAIAWDSLEGRDPPAREWIVPHWIPHGHVTLLAGRGGIGKTLFAQHLGTALALKREYLETLEPRRVLMWAGEDDEAELWRRQANICSWMQMPLSALTERFYLHSYAGDDITLMASTFGALAPTPMLEALRQQVADYRAEVVILDNVAKLYGGNENDRHGVTTFCAVVQGACAPAAVILLGHPAKGLGSEYSGSTAWEGAVRARLYLSDRPPEQDGDGEEPVDERVRYICRRKANYSDRDIRRLNLLDGVLIPDDVPPVRAGQPAGELLKDIVRRAVGTLAARAIHGTASTASPNYLPKLARQYALLESTSEKSFASAMRAMIMDGDLLSAEVGRNANRTPKTGLVLPPNEAHR